MASIPVAQGTVVQGSPPIAVAQAVPISQGQPVPMSAPTNVAEGQPVGRELSCCCCRGKQAIQWALWLALALTLLALWNFLPLRQANYSYALGGHGTGPAEASAYCAVQNCTEVCMCGSEACDFEAIAESVRTAPIILFCATLWGIFSQSLGCFALSQSSVPLLKCYRFLVGFYIVLSVVGQVLLGVLGPDSDKYLRAYLLSRNWFHDEGDDVECNDEWFTKLGRFVMIFTIVGAVLQILWYIFMGHLINMAGKWANILSKSSGVPEV